MSERTHRRAETRERILTAAGRLFRQHGIDGVGIDAVMKEAGLTHGGFYLHFPSKEALTAEVSQALLTKSAAKWQEISRQCDPQATLERIVTDYLNPVHVASDHGCLLAKLGADVARRSASKEAISGALHSMLDVLANSLPGHSSQRALAALSTMVGAVVLARLAGDAALSEAFLTAAGENVLEPGRVARALDPGPSASAHHDRRTLT